MKFVCFLLWVTIHSVTSILNVRLIVITPSFSNYEGVSRAIDQISRLLALQFGNNVAISDIVYVHPTQNMDQCHDIDEGIVDLLAQYDAAYPTLFQRSSNTLPVALHFGDVCGPGEEEMAKYLNAMNVFFATASRTDHLSNNAKFPNAVHLGPASANVYLQTLRQILQRYSWTEISVICKEPADPPWSFGEELCFKIKELDGQARLKGITIYMENIKNATELKAALLRAKTRSRVIFSPMRWDWFRSMMITAARLNMTDGKFIYFAASSFTASDDQSVRFWERGDDDDQVAIQAADSVLIIADLLSSVIGDRRGENTPFAPPFIRPLGNDVDPTQVLSRLSQSFGNMLPMMVPVPGGRPNPMEVVSRTPLGLSVMALLYVVVECLAKVRTDVPMMTDAPAIARSCLNRTYHLPTRRLTFGPDGSLDNWLPVTRLNKTTGDFEVAFEQRATDQSHQIVDTGLMKWHDWPGFPPPRPPCGYEDDECKLSTEQTAGTSAGIGAAVLVILLLSAVLSYRKVVFNQKFSHLFFKTTEDLKRESKRAIYHTNGSLTFVCYPVAYGRDTVLASEMALDGFRDKLKHYKPFQDVILKVHGIRHSNILTFIGVLLSPSETFLITEYCSRSTLKDLLNASSVATDLHTRLFFALDLIKAIRVVHQSTFVAHGFISFTSCFVTSRFELKLGFLGYFELLAAAQRMQHGTLPDISKTHPAEDIFSFGIILKRLTQEDLSHGKDDDQVSAIIKDLVEKCTQTEPSMRPSASDAQKILDPLRKSKNIVQYILGVLEQKARELESVVHERTGNLAVERDKVDLLLAEMLPREIIKKLRNKEEITPEVHPSVSIMFTDIPAFQTLALDHSPFELTELLNTTHSAFDRVVSGDPDAYKVETINDSYVLASGLPQPNGEHHASVLCSISLKLIAAMQSVRQVGSWKVDVNVRIGINSGLVAAGVVGTLRPRYCLFGDTMNTASRMESHSAAGKVHVSATTHSIANTSGRFLFESRGLTTIKGKGEMETFWLLDELHET